MKTDRKSWLNKAKILLQKYDVLIIEGLRRIGKTVIMNDCSEFEMFNTYQKIEFQVGLFGQDDRAVALKLIEEFKSNSNKKHLLLVDEFQDLDGWARFFRTIFDLKNVKVIATGSVSANENLVSNTEGGRFAYVHMRPLSFHEYKDIYSKNSVPKSLDILFNIYATMGSYPDQEFNVDINNLNIYKKQVSENIIEKVKNVSLLKKAGLENEGHVMKVLLFIIDHNGSTMSVNSISQNLQIHLATVKKIISYLKQSFLIYEVANSRQGIGRAAATNTKYYLNDHTFYLFVSSEKFENLNPQKKALLFENIIFNSVRDDFERHIATVHFEIDKDTKADIDLVIKKGREKHYFEIKYSSKVDCLSPNQKSFTKKNKLSVIYLGKTKFNKELNIQYINYIEFMEGSEKWIMNK